MGLKFLDEQPSATATNAPPTAAAPQQDMRVWAAPEESTAQYWSRSPLVRDAAANVTRGATAVGRAGRELGEDLQVGADVATYPYRVAAREVFKPALYAGADYFGRGADVARDYVGRGAKIALAGAGNLAGKGARWLSDRVLPLPLPSELQTVRPAAATNAAPAAKISPFYGKLITDKSGKRYRYLGNMDNPALDTDEANWQPIP